VGIDAGEGEVEHAQPVRLGLLLEGVGGAVVRIARARRDDAAHAEPGHPGRRVQHGHVGDLVGQDRGEPRVVAVEQHARAPQAREHDDEPSAGREGVGGGVVHEVHGPGQVRPMGHRHELREQPTHAREPRAGPVDAGAAALRPLHVVAPEVAREPDLDGLGHHVQHGATRHRMARRDGAARLVEAAVEALELRGVSPGSGCGQAARDGQEHRGEPEPRRAVARAHVPRGRRTLSSPSRGATA